MAAKTFNCPACGRLYPFKPVLLQRTMRCSDCSSVFRVESDHHVRLLQRSNPQLPQQQNTTINDSIEPSSTGSTQYRAHTQRLTARQQRVRSQLTQRLNAAALEAANSTEKRTPIVRRTSSSQRQAGTETFNKGAFEPVISGNGEEAAQQRKLWRVIVSGALVLVLVMWGLMTIFHNKATHIAAQLLAPHDGDHWGAPQRHQIVRERFIIYPTEQLVLGTLGDNFRAGAVRQLPWPTEAGDALTAFLNTYTRLDAGIWVRKLDRAAAQTALRKADGKQWRMRDLPDQVQSSLIEDRHLKRTINGMGFDDTMAAILEPLVRGGDQLTARGMQLREQFINGGNPKALEIIIVNGTNGGLLLEQGNGYSIIETAYTLQLMRVVWPDDQADTSAWVGWNVSLKPGQP